MNEEELLKKLRAAFKMEAEERLAAISSGLLELEKLFESKDSSQRQFEILEEIFREAHSLKGASRAVNLVDIENLCQPMESVFSALKKNELSLFPELFDTLHTTLEVIEELLVSPDNTQKVTPLFRQLEELRHQKPDKSKLPDIKKQNSKKNIVDNTDKIVDKKKAKSFVKHKETNSYNIDNEYDDIVDEDNNDNFDKNQKDKSIDNDLKVYTKASDNERKKVSDKKKAYEDNEQSIKIRKNDEKNISDKEKESNQFGDLKQSQKDEPISSEKDKNYHESNQSENFNQQHRKLSDEVKSISNKSSRSDNFNQLPKDQKLSNDESNNSHKQFNSDKVNQIQNYQKNIGIKDNKPIIGDTVRISVSKLDSLMLKVEELVSLKLEARQHLSYLKEIIRNFDLWKKHWTSLENEFRWLRRQVGKKDEQIDNFDQYNSILEFLEWNHDNNRFLENKIKSLKTISEHNQRSLSTMVDDVLDDMKKVTMLPFSTLSVILPKMVRDISKAQGKEVELIISGSELELDRRILEEMKDPLIHLLRNSIDHGIETPNERLESKKSKKGIIQLIISQNTGNKVEIQIKDDGKGIDIERVKDEAVKRSILTRKEVDNMNDKDAMSLIFKSDLSTSPIITQISGRGLGMAIVQGKVQQLGGILNVESQKGVGTSFTIQLPVTLATSRGILIRVNNNQFVVPVTHIERVIRLKWEEVKTAQNKATIPLNGGVLSFVDLADILEMDKSTKDKSDLAVVMVLEVGTKQIAFRVDEVLGEQEVLVKSLGNQLSRVKNIAGATILGSGKVVPILNVHDLLISSSKSSLIRPVITSKDDESETKTKKILVAEDSITSRMLIQNILESAGYIVKTAVDGYDAYTIFKTEEFDLVVTDVEMPRMNGFELTKQIRSDNKKGEIPVILVTSLQSPEDRKEGIDAGANAYIVKSNFDQNNLLEVIERLV